MFTYVVNFRKVQQVSSDLNSRETLFDLSNSKLILPSSEGFKLFVYNEVLCWGCIGGNV